MRSPKAAPVRHAPAKLRWILVLFALCLILAPAAQTQPPGAAKAALPTGWRFNFTIPLGTDLLVLRPSKQTVALLASAESNEFKDWQLVEIDGKRNIIGLDGKPIRNMPRHIIFRITAGNKDKISDEAPYPIDINSSLNDFLLSLKFRLKIFRGMDARELEPEETKVIGVPADEPYNERIFRTSFDVGDVKIDDRLVLEIYAGNNDQRISKFHLEF